MLTSAQRTAYDRNGLLHLPGAVDRAATLAMCDALWHGLIAAHGIRRDDPSTWAVARPTGLAARIKPDAFAAMASPTVESVLDELLGAGRWIRPQRWGVTLVTFPDHGGDWDVPHQQWHMDGPALPHEPAIARVFVLLATLEPGGGNTVVAAGSHRLMQKLAARAERPLKSPDAKRQLQAEQPWFAALSSASESHDRVQRFMQTETLIDGIPVRVVEMTGEPGDVYFMHPFMLHAASRNVRTQPRLAVTQWIDGSGSREPDGETMV